MKILITLALIFSASLNAEEPRKPNILFILVDDQSPFDFKFHNPESTLDYQNAVMKHFDTHPFLRAPESLPGTRPDMYYQNAESFLLIGDALGKAMLKLQEK